MKICSFFLLLVLFIVPASAADVYDSSLDIEDPIQTIRVIDSSTPLDVVIVGEEVPQGDPDDVGVVARTLEPITPSNTTGLKKILLSLLGNYNSIVTDYRYQNSNGTYSYLRTVQPDYVWLVSAAIFAIVLWCTLRAGVYFVCKR